MKNRIQLLAALTLTSISYASTDENSEVSNPSAEMVACSGTITNYMRDQTPAQLITHGCVWFEKTESRSDDATWVKITSPEEFKGTTHILITNDETINSPFGNIGDEIQFSALREILESDKKWFSSTSSSSTKGLQIQSSDTTPANDSH